MNENESAVPMPGWVQAVLWIQAVIAVLFLLLGWSHTKGTQLGRGPSALDIITLALPLVLTVAAMVSVPRLWRAGRRDVATLLALSPLLVSMLAMAVLGAV